MQVMPCVEIAPVLRLIMTGHVPTSTRASLKTQPSNPTAVRNLGNQPLQRAHRAGYGYSADLIGYGVELSRAATGQTRTGQTRKKGATNGRPGTRGRVDRSAILEAAFKLFAREGDDGFSLRKLGLSVGVD